MWCIKYDMWHVMCCRWHETCDTWHMTHHTSASPLSHPYHLHIFIVFIIFVNSSHRYRLGVTFPFHVQRKSSCNSVNTLIWDHNCWQTDGCIHIITVSNVPRNCPITQTVVANLSYFTQSFTTQTFKDHSRTWIKLLLKTYLTPTPRSLTSTAIHILGSQPT